VRSVLLAATNDAVTITASANRALYGAHLSVINAGTEDLRCVRIGERDFGCRLGDLKAGETVTVTAGFHEQAVDVLEDAVYCVLYGFITPDKGVASLRSFACKATP
jgi:hypothetical protein